MKKYLRNECGWFIYKMSSKLIGLIFWNSELATEYKGFLILVLLRSDSSFLSQTKKAIDFIERHDVRRFHVLQKNINGIFPVRLTKGFCCIDEGFCSFIYNRLCLYPEDIRVPLYASMLVREAVRIRIAKRISYKKIFRDQSLERRVEAMCCLEAVRFTLKFPEKMSETAVYLQNLILIIVERKVSPIRGSGQIQNTLPFR